MQRDWFWLTGFFPECPGWRLSVSSFSQELQFNCIIFCPVISFDHNYLVKGPFLLGWGSSMGLVSGDSAAAWLHHNTVEK